VTHRRDLLGGLVLVAIGVFLLLRNLGYIPPTVDQWWPVILIVIGLALVFSRPGVGAAAREGAGRSPLAPPVEGTTEGHRRAPMGGLILIGLGLALLANNLLGGQAAGPLLLIALGLAVLVGRVWWPPS
jgi:uncharacterized membrane protein